MTKKKLSCLLLFVGLLLCVLAKFDVFSSNHSSNSSEKDSVQPVYVAESVKNKEVTKSDTKQSQNSAEDEEGRVTFGENDMYFPECSDLPLPDDADTYRCIRHDLSECYTYSFYLGTTDDEEGKMIFKSYVKKLKNNGFTTNYKGDYNDAHWAGLWYSAYNKEKECSAAFLGYRQRTDNEQILNISFKK